MSKVAVAIRHVAFEDLGNLEDVLKTRNYIVKYYDANKDNLTQIIELKPDLLIILGGPMGVYQRNEYPFLILEDKIIKDRLEKKLPLLGICLGAQLIAYALGSAVYPGKKKEIGWFPIYLTPEGKATTYMYPLSLDHLKVLHWHGDTFDLPRKTIRLASSKLYENQAFSYQNYCLALQFHAEVTEPQLEHWYKGHNDELIQTSEVNLALLKADTKVYSSLLQKQSKIFWNKWLDFFS